MSFEIRVLPYFNASGSIPIRNIQQSNYLRYADTGVEKYVNMLHLLEVNLVRSKDILIQFLFNSVHPENYLVYILSLSLSFFLSRLTATVLGTYTNVLYWRKFLSTTCTVTALHVLLQTQLVDLFLPAISRGNDLVSTTQDRKWTKETDFKI